MKKRLSGGDLFKGVVQAKRKAAKVPGPSEDRIQTGCIQWWRVQYPRWIYLLFHIPNGGFRTKAEGGIFKRMGVVPGVSDLFLAVACEGYHGFFIEMKRPGNTQSDYQKDFASFVRSQGYKYAVIDDVSDFMIQVQSYLRTWEYYKPSWKELKDINKRVDKL